MRDLSALFDPRSVAIVGASNDPAKWGNYLARRALKGRDRRGVYFVNRKGGRILGEKAYTSLSDLPETAQLVVVTVPAAAVEEVVDQAVEMGTKALVVITAGFGETDKLGKEREQAIVARVRSGGAILVGPNCLGVFDSTAGLDLVTADLPPGRIGLISQSGNLALEIGMLARDAGIGFSRFVSVGNQADVDVVDAIEEFAVHEPTQVIALYVEDFRDGRRFARVAADASARGKPIVLLSVLSGDASARAAFSHTAALVSSRRVVAAACAASGIHLVSTPKEIVDLAQVLTLPQAPRGRRLAVVSDGGGHGVIATGIASRDGFEIPALSRALADLLNGLLPGGAATMNPIDLIGAEQDFSLYERVIRLVLQSGEVDAVLLTGYFGGYSRESAEFCRAETDVARQLAAAARGANRPLVVHTMNWSSVPARTLRRKGVPVYREVESVTRSLMKLVEHEENPPHGVPVLPIPDRDVVRGDDYWTAREIIKAAGISCIDARRVSTFEEAGQIAREFGYPVVLKAVSATHKSDVGGVVLDIRNDAQLRATYDDFCARLGEGNFSVERMASSRGVELIIGIRVDARFGPVIMAGMGGVYAELLEDTATALAPVDAGHATELLMRLRGSKLMTGFRGSPALDVSAAGQAVARLSWLASRLTGIQDLEVNPLLVMTEGVIALDARLSLAPKANCRDRA